MPNIDPSSLKKNLQSNLSKKMTEIEEESGEEHASVLANKANLPYIDLRKFPIDTGALFLVDEAIARSAGAAVITKKGLTLSIATSDSNTDALNQLIQNLTTKGFTIKLLIASHHGLSLAWNRYQNRTKTVSTLAGVINLNDISDIEKQIKSISDLQGKVTQLPVTQVLDILIAGALNIGASDIHLEPEEREVRLRYRLDGVLTDVLNLTTTVYSQLLSRLKLTAGLKINLHEAPQDGRITIRRADKDIELRVSVLPGAYGENIVMRILDPSSIRQKLEDLGMREDTLEEMKVLLLKNAGAILTTGPTGSGKTTTLYAFVQHINSPDIKVITIEDPIEYHIDGISQTQVHEDAGYTFADGLRAIVRQDPDVILIGEIRDQETGEIAMQASLTGHLVLSTIHTNSAAGTIPRLVDLGVKAVTVAPALVAAMAQRLVRRLCSKCKKHETIHDADFKLLHKYLDNLPSVVKTEKISESMKIFYPNPQGCADCNSIGYKGRIGIYEVFSIDTEMQKLISKNPVLTEVQELAVKKGMVTLLQDAFIKVIEGNTSVDEVMRVVGE